MVVRKSKEDRFVRETQPVVLPVKQKESLSYMNSREFTPPLEWGVEQIPFRSPITVIHFIYGVWNPS